MKIKFARSLLLIAMCVCSCRFGTNANETERTNAEKVDVQPYSLKNRLVQLDL